MRPMSPILASAVLLGVLAPATVSLAATEVRTFALRYEPSETDKDLSPTVPADVLAVPLRVAKVTDGRPGGKDPAVVGRFLNKDVEVRVDRPVTTHATDVLNRLLEHWNATLDPKGARTLESEIRMFEVEVDSGAFNANVHVLFRLRDDAGKTYTYQAVHSGHDGTVGFRSKDANYNKVLSNALREAVVALLSDPKFHDAVRGRADSIVVTVVSPQTLLHQLIPLLREKVSEDTLLQFVRERNVKGSFSDADVAAWKDAGIPARVLREAMERAGS